MDIKNINSSSWKKPHREPHSKDGESSEETGTFEEPKQLLIRGRNGTTFVTTTTNEWLSTWRKVLD